MTADVGFDLVYWQVTDDDDLQPRVEALSQNQPDAPTLVSATAGDQQMVLNVNLNDDGDTAYIRWRRPCAAEWSAISEDYKLTASGNITITGLTNYRPYDFVAVSKNGTIYSMMSNILTETPVPATNRIRTRLRDKSAAAVLKIAQKLGTQITISNPNDSDVTVWAIIPDEGNYNVTTIAESDQRRLVFVVPRQSCFPPDRFYPQVTVTHQSLVWGVDNVVPDNEDINMASTFRLECSSYSNQVEIGVDD